MNLILFQRDELGKPLPADDPRAIHLLKTLRRQPGDLFDAGIIDGERLKGQIREIDDHRILIDFKFLEMPPPLHPVHLLIGLPRPQTARKILQEASSLGVAEIHFAQTEKGEPSYRDSRLWTTGEYRRHLIAGAEQAFTTRIPLLIHHENVPDAIDHLTARLPGIALDNYEATGFLRDFHPPASGSFLAIGPERGWSAAERDHFRLRKIPLLQLGETVLRTETATLCALAILLSQMKLL